MKGYNKIPNELRNSEEGTSFLSGKSQSEPWSWKILTFISYLVTAMLLVAVFMYRQPLYVNVHPSTTLPDRHPQALTSEHTIPTFFDEDRRYQSLDPSQDHYWNDLTPHMGLIRRKADTDDIHVYGMSMFHQLHCLSQLRSAIQELYLMALNGTKLTTNSEEPVVPTHVLHCLDYIRQTTLCNADATIENEKYNEDGNVVVNGMDFRMCRDSSRLYEKLEASWLSLDRTSVPGHKAV